MTPLSWACSKPSTIWRPKRRTSSGGSPPGGDTPVERPPIHVFHGDVGIPFRFSDFIDRADIRVVESGGGLSLLGEAFLSRWNGGQSGDRNFKATVRLSRVSSAL